MKTLIIPADGSEVRWEDPEKIDLDYLQGQVGGFIEAVEIGNYITANDITIYLHEEGKILGLRRNERATRFARKHGGIVLMDFIVGDVVIVGAPDEDGEDTGLKTRVQRWLEEELNQLG